MLITAEMLSISPDGTIAPFPNRLRITRHGKQVIVEISAIHDGHQITSTVVVEAGVFRHHVTGSGILCT